MAIYIVRRLLWVVLLLFVITLVTFVIFNVLPAGDPAALRAGRQPSAELIAAIRQQLGLDDPSTVQFIRYIGDILPFVGGTSTSASATRTTPRCCRSSSTASRPRSSSRSARWSCGWPSAIPIGIISAVERGSLLDRAHDGRRAGRDLGARLLARARRRSTSSRDDIGRFPIFPGTGAYQERRRHLRARRVAAAHAVVRAGGRFAAIYARFLRGEPDRDHAGGLHPHRPRQGLSRAPRDLQARVRSAITPIVTLLGLDVGILLGGAILTETVFNIQGIGRFAYEGISRQTCPWCREPCCSARSSSRS